MQSGAKTVHKTSTKESNLCKQNNVMSANQAAQVIVSMYSFLCVYAADDARASVHHDFVYMCVTWVIRERSKGKIKGTLHFLFQFESLRACVCVWG